MEYRENKMGIEEGNLPCALALELQLKVAVMEEKQNTQASLIEHHAAALSGIQGELSQIKYYMLGGMVFLAATNPKVLSLVQLMV